MTKQKALRELIRKAISRDELIIKTKKQYAEIAKEYDKGKMEQDTYISELEGLIGVFIR